MHTSAQAVADSPSFMEDEDVADEVLRLKHRIERVTIQRDTARRHEELVRR